MRFRPGDDKAVRWFPSIPLDNVLKEVLVGKYLEPQLERWGGGVQFTVPHTIGRPVERDEVLCRLDRFYRAAHARTVGLWLWPELSVARSIVVVHEGETRAESRQRSSLFVAVSLPA